MKRPGVVAAQPGTLFEYHEVEFGSALKQAQRDQWVRSLPFEQMMTFGSLYYTPEWALESGEYGC